MELAEHSRGHTSLFFHATSFPSGSWPTPPAVPMAFALTAGTKKRCRFSGNKMSTPAYNQNFNLLPAWKFLSAPLRLALAFSLFALLLCLPGHLSFGELGEEEKKRDEGAEKAGVVLALLRQLGIHMQALFLVRCICGFLLHRGLQFPWRAGKPLQFTPLVPSCTCFLSGPFFRLCVHLGGITFREMPCWLPSSQGTLLCVDSTRSIEYLSNFSCELVPVPASSKLWRERMRHIINSPISLPQWLRSVPRDLHACDVFTQHTCR